MNMADDARLPATAPARLAAARPPAIPRAIAEAARSAREAPSARCSSSARSSAGRRSASALARVRRRVRRAVLPERHGARRAPARASAPHEPLAQVRARAGRRRRSCFGTPFDFRVDYGRTRHVARRREGRADRSRRRRARPEPRGRRRDPRRQRARARAALAERPRAEAARPAWLADGARRRGQARSEDAAADGRRATIPPNPLRVCAELGKRLGPNDIVIGDGGDFVATAAYVLKLEWPQLWMDPGPLGTLGVGPGYAMAAKLARPDASVVLDLRRRLASASTRSSSRRWCGRRSRSSRIIGNDAGVDADPPRPGRDLRRGARGGDGARLHPLRRSRARAGRLRRLGHRSGSRSAPRSTRLSRAATRRAST